ncbi:hypothetical protein LIER_32054 [Lithospermum erythrorhizon]|uniref:Gag-pol polyprotein n=1 Tax=Lithospermum erythrorhizon TaxID=34254 RepID=A0AAV3RYR0_LITER
MQQPFRRIQCHEYEGYGHIQSECAKFLKRQNINYYTSLSDDESEKEKDEVAFMVSMDSGSASEESPIGRGNDGDITTEEVFKHYETVFENWNDLRKTIEQQEEIQRLNLQLERMMNVGTGKLDEILQIVNPFVDKLTEGVKTRSDWFLDSGCSIHMTGNPSAVADVLTFGDGRKGQIIVRGWLNVKVKKDKELGESSMIKSEEDPGNCQYQFQLLQQILPHVQKEDVRSLHDKLMREVKNTEFRESLGLFQSELRRRLCSLFILGCWESHITGE